MEQEQLVVLEPGVLAEVVQREPEEATLVEQQVVIIPQLEEVHPLFKVMPVVEQPRVEWQKINQPKHLMFIVENTMQKEMKYLKLTFQ